jgi:23S rRNA (cytosine1962-C5)-methyltransferase
VKAALVESLAKRGNTFEGVTTAYRLCDGAGDRLPGLYIDRYGPAAIVSVYEDARLDHDAVTDVCETVLHTLLASGLESVYVKSFVKDRSRLGGRVPSEASDPAPRSGRAQPESIVIDEHDVRFEVRLWDGLSTGLFLDHREHRRDLAQRGARRVLNLFAYTCGFSVPLAAAGASVTNVDVSARYLDWGRRNHGLNDVGSDSRGAGAIVRYQRMDAMAYLAYAARHAEQRYDLIVIDPPTFGAADRRRGVAAWSVTKDYPSLLAAAAEVLEPGGSIFAATNARALAGGSVLRQLIESAVGRPRWETLPPWPPDIRERGRVAAALFTPR